MLLLDGSITGRGRRLVGVPPDGFLVSIECKKRNESVGEDAV
jgi:hypothetical protein